MNGQCDKCSSLPQWKNDDKESEEDEESSSDSKDDDDKRNITFYRWGKNERTQKICITIDEVEAWETLCVQIKDLKAHIYRKRKQVN